MDKILKVSLIVTLALSSTFLMAEEEVQPREIKKSVKKAVATFAPSEEKEISTVDKFRQMFTDGEVSGQLKLMYAGYDYENGDSNTYATAVGGTIKYELAEYNGFNAGVAFSISHDMGFVTGDNSKQNDELSSTSGEYTELTEACINYKYQDLNLRVGRQMIDTPLADSDDIRMIANTFEAYIATYNLDGFELMAGNLQKWQGVDAGLDNEWDNKTGEDGTWFGGISYADDIEFSAW
ncbi:MAG: OprD family outer membrane porin, partial [Sulfurimonas sp.]|nr:OprD family outer membrane porin [Sulfurimonas sp.]